MEELRVLLYPLPLAIIVILLGAFFMARGSRAGTIFVFAALIGLWILATEPVSQYLRSQLENQYPAVAAESVPEVDAIVILGGGVVSAMPPRVTPELGHAGDRVRMGFELYQAGRAPLIVTTGGAHRADAIGQSEAEATAALLQSWGVPEDDIVVRGESHSTYEDALAVRRVVELRDIDRVLLVTSAMHMPRSVGVFTGRGINVVPVPANFEGRPDQPGQWTDWIPSAEPLWISTRAWHEYLGTLHYRMRGWVE